MGNEIGEAKSGRGDREALIAAVYKSGVGQTTVDLSTGPAQR